MTTKKNAFKKTILILTMFNLPTYSLADDLGLIQVESSTIDDRHIDWRSEPSSVAVISGEKVDENHTENIQQMLQSIPGVTTELQSGDSLKIHIRGVDNNRFMGEKPGVAIVIDGVPVFERTGKVNIDLDNIETIRVIKGGASFLFGEDALAGAIIITTKRGAKYAGYKLAAETGSFGYQKGLARMGVGEEQYSFHLQASTRSADGYYFQSDYQANYLNGKLEYYLDDDSDIRFGFEHSNREKDSHGTVTGVSQAETDPQSVDGRDYARMFDVNLAKYFLTYNWDLSEKKNLMVNIYQFTDDTDYKSSPVRYDASGAIVTDVDAYSTQNIYQQIQQGLKSELRGSSNKMAWLAGIDIRNNEYDNYAEYITDFKSSPFSPTVNSAGTVVADNITDETVKAIYAEYKYSHSKDTVLTLNGRYDHIQLDYLDDLDNLLNGEEEFYVTSWRLGANHQLRQQVGIYATLSTGFRAPSAEELFYGDTNLGAYVEPNRDLNPEKTLNKEIGLHAQDQWFNTQVNIDLAIFQLDRDDFIMPSVGQYASANLGTSSFENIGGARHRGLELSIQTDDSKTWSFNLAFTYMDAVFTDYDNYYLSLGNPYTPFASSVLYDNTGNHVPRVPKSHINLSTVYQISSQQKLTAEIDSISSYYADEINQEKIDGHSVLNLLWNYGFKKTNSTSWSIFFRVDNALDEFYYNTARGFYDADYDGDYDAEDLSIVVNQGRSYTAGAGVKF